MRSKFAKWRRTMKVAVKKTDFEFLKVLGEGSFGSVLLARSKWDKKFSAIKVIKKRDQLSLIINEYRVLRQITGHHPFLMSMHCSFQTDESIYMCLDYMVGGDLFELLNEAGYFNETGARFYAAELVSALTYLHATGFVHRDIKLENLLVDRDGHVVLTDFNLSRKMTETQTIIEYGGTPVYMAPEVVLREPHGFAVDWWGVGVVLFEMIYGMRPFERKDTNEEQHAIVNDQLTLPTRPLRRDRTGRKCESCVSNAALQLIAALLRKDARERLTNPNAIKGHPFFAGLSWWQLEQRLLTPPCQPDPLSFSPYDTESGRSPRSVLGPSEWEAPTSRTVVPQLNFISDQVSKAIAKYRHRRSSRPTVPLLQKVPFLGRLFCTS